MMSRWVDGPNLRLTYPFLIDSMGSPKESGFTFVCIVIDSFFALLNVHGVELGWDTFSLL